MELAAGGYTDLEAARIAAHDVLTDRAARAETGVGARTQLERPRRR
jgi:hypothetical protein